MAARKKSAAPHQPEAQPELAAVLPKPRIERDTLFAYGQEYDLTQYNGQQYWQVGNDTVQALLTDGRLGPRLPVENLDEARANESLLNGYFKPGIR